MDGDELSWDEGFASDMVGNPEYFASEEDSLGFIDEDVGTAWEEGVAESRGAGEYEDEGGEGFEYDDESEDVEGDSDESGDERGDSDEDAEYEEEGPGGDGECADLDEGDSGAGGSMEGGEEYALDENV